MTSIVKFSKRYEGFVAGDIAGFPEASPVLKIIIGEGFGIVLETKEICLDNPKIDPSWGKRLPKVKETLICPICGKQLKSKSELNRHKVQAHGIE